MSDQLRCPDCGKIPERMIKGVCHRCYSRNYARLNRDKQKEYMKKFRESKSDDVEYQNRRRAYDREYQANLRKEKNRIYKLYKQGKLKEVDE